MDANTWAKVEDLFERVAGLPAEERARALAAETDDLLLRAEVERLLGDDFPAEKLLDEIGQTVVSPALAAALDAGDPLINARIGPYEIKEHLGSGGMGTVYRAERTDGVYDQSVALKLVRRDVPQALATRFAAERQILARLQHPGIARIHDGGVAEDGRPWLAMELVEGRPIIEHADRQRLSIDQRLELFATVCDVVAHAHGRLVVHRDLKPSNILVTETGQVKLLDFGIAKLLEDDPAAELTQMGGRVLTPEYAAPEQLRGEAISVATDVYSLGVLLFELLTARWPYDTEATSPREAERIVLEQQPSKPSAALLRAPRSRRGDFSADEVVAARNIDQAGLRKVLGGDLEVIVLKALRKDPDRRYASAQAFADDVRRYLTGFPVSARPESLPYVWGRFVRRNRVPVAAVAIVLLALVGGLGAALSQAARADRQQARAEELAAQATASAERAQETMQFMIDLFATASPQYSDGGARTADEMLEIGLERARTQLDDPEIQTHVMNVIAAVYSGQGRYDEAEELIGEAVAIRSEHFPPPSTQMAEVLHTLGSIHLEQRRDEEAVQTLTDALEMRRLLLAADSDHLLATLNNYGVALRNVGRYDEAVDVLDEAAGIWLASKGEESYDYALALNNVGLLHMQLEDFDAAAAAFEQSSATHARLLGDDHPHVGIGWMNLADARAKTDRFREAEELARNALAVLEDGLGFDHPATIHAFTVLGRALARNDKAGEAVITLERAHQQAVTRFGAESRHAVSLLEALDEHKQAPHHASHHED